LPIADSQGKREQILIAALRLFDENGFRGTSMATIAEEAEVGAGTIYRYFDGKEDLVHQLYAAARQEAHQSILGLGFDDEASVRERLYTLWRAVLLDYVDCPRLYRFILKYESSGYRQADARAQTEDLEAPFEEIYRDGVEQGLFADRPKSVYAAFFAGTVTQLVQDHLNGDTTLDDDLIAQTFDMLWAAYTADGAAG
jgi:AcrR family transcriptional regulator